MSYATCRFSLLTLLALSSLTGCSSYIGSYYYTPRPAVAIVPATQPGGPPALAAVASVIGVHRADSGLKIPTSVEVRFRLDNNGPQTVTFDPASLQLLNGSLQEFPAPLFRPAQPITLSPAQSGVVAAYFPFPPGQSYDTTDLESVQLRWVVQFDGHPLPEAADFHRMAPPVYYRPYWDYYGPAPWFTFYGGGLFFGGGHRR